ncbi:MAG: hypothetical protein AAF921_13445 [Cyanobacteria bacterium P01_D01_bin.44]
MISAHTPPDAVTVQSACAKSAGALTDYQAQLHPWCIVRLLPKMQRVVVGRFRKANDAETHVRSLKKFIPHAQFVVIFDPGENTTPKNSE